MIIMNTHFLHRKSDDDTYHYASSASPAVMMIIMNAHRLLVILRMHSDKYHRPICDEDAYFMIIIMTAGDAHPLHF